MYVDPFIVGFICGFFVGIVSLILLALIVTDRRNKNGKEKDV